MANSAVVGILRALLTANTAEYETAMRGAAESAKVFSREMKTVGQQATQVGSMLTKTLTLPIVGIGGTVAKLAMDFESSFANVRKTVEGSEGELNDLAKVFRAMAKEIPATTDELNKIAALGGQMGVPINQLEHFTRNVAALGVAVDGISTEDAAAGLAQIGNATGTGTTKIAEMASALVHLGNKSNATESDILEFTKRLIGAGNTVGMTVPEVMALGTAMANVGINAEAGGTAMSLVIGKISKAVSMGGESVRAFADVAGLSAEEFSAVWRDKPIEALDRFVQGLGTMKARGVDLNLTMGEIGTEGIRVADTLKRLAGAGDGVAKSVVIANEGFASARKHLDEAETKYATVANQLKLLWNAIKDVGITLGEALLPAITASIGIVKQFLPVVELLARVFVSLPQPVQMTVLAMAAVAAAVGPLIYIFGQLALSASAIAGAFTAKGLAARAAALSLSVTNAAAVTLTGTMNALGVAIGAMPIAAATAGIGLLAIGVTKLYEAAQKGKVFTETAAAKQDTINLAIQRGAEATINYTDAIKFNNEWMEKRLAAGRDQERENVRLAASEKNVTDKIVDLNARVVAADKEIAQLSTTARSQLAAAIRMGAFTMKELAESTGLSELALKRFETSVKTSDKAAEKATTAITAFKDSVEAATVKAGLSVFALNRLGSITIPTVTSRAREFAEVLETWTPLMGESIDQTELMELAEKKHADQLTRSRDALRAQLAGVIGLMPAYGGLKERTDENTEAAKEWVDALAPMERVLQGIQTDFAQMATVAIRAFREIGAAWRNTGLSKGDKIATTLTTGLAAGASIAGGSRTGRALSGAASGAATGAAIGSIVPGIGTAFGAGVGAIVGGLVGLFKKSGPSLKDLRNEFTKVGTDLNKLGTDLRAAGLGHLLTDIFAATKVKDFEAAVLRAQSALQKHQQTMELGKNTWERVRDVLQKYNIDIGKLGPAFRGQMLIEQTKDLYEEWKLLEGVGVDIKDVAFGMKDRINEFVQIAKKAGTEVPQEWKPLIQSLIDQGLLVDENGDKYETLEATGLTFAQTVSQALGGIETAIRDMIDALLQFLGLAQHPPDWAGWVPPANPGASAPQVPPGEGTPPQQPDVQAATGGLVTARGIRRFGVGGMVPSSPFSQYARGTDTVMGMLTPGELIMTVGQQANVAAAIAGGGGGGTETVIIHTHVMLDEREIAMSVERVQSGRLRARRRLRSA